jgi:hypothetical protein
MVFKKSDYKYKYYFKQKVQAYTLVKITLGSQSRVFQERCVTQNIIRWESVYNISNGILCSFVKLLAAGLYAIFYQNEQNSYFKTVSN